MAFEAPALVLRALAEHAANEPWAVALGAVALAVLGLKFFPSIVAPSPATYCRAARLKVGRSSLS